MFEQAIQSNPSVSMNNDEALSNKKRNVTFVLQKEVKLKNNFVSNIKNVFNEQSKYSCLCFTCYGQLPIKNYTLNVFIIKSYYKS